MGLDQLLGARPQVLSVVQHGLIGPAGQVSQQHPAAVAKVGGQTLGEGDGESGCPGAARATDRDQLTEPGGGRGFRECRRKLVAAADQLTMGGQHAEQVVSAEVGR